MIGIRPRADRRGQSGEMGIEDMSSKIQFRVSDIRQYVYCPRVIYFNYVLPVPRRRTVKMEAGRDAHIDFSEMEKRRTLAKYKLTEGERRFRVPLNSSSLGLTGVLDMLVVSPVGSFPVEFKNTSGGMGLHHKYQLVAYAMMAEASMAQPVRMGFVYVIPTKKVFSVQIHQGARVHVLRVLGAMRNMVSSQKMPPVVRSMSRCRDCEFKNYCRGV